jgi:glycine betaine/proline transport system ATP-binding protein
MQQRVGLARALALDPQVLFFDEPFSALDPLIRRDMQAELLALQETMHRTIVFITHDFAEALRLGDRIAIMKDGVFDQVGTSEEIVARPATDYVREFTTDIPKSKVLTVRSVMHAGETNGVRRVPSHTKIGQLIPLLLDSGDPICVVDEEGQPLGIVDRDSVAALLGDESR